MMYLCFRDSNLFILRLLFKKGFSHCILVKHDEASGVVTVIEPLSKDIDTFSIKLDDIPRALFNSTGVTTLKLKRIDVQTRKRPLFGLFTCANIVQYFIGTNFLAFTPWMLYKKLTKYNLATLYKEE